MEGNLQELAAQKEQEWKEVQRLQTQALESALLEKEKLLNEERKQFVKLKDDFKYNLKLLMERDQELERFVIPDHFYSNKIMWYIKRIR